MDINTILNGALAVVGLYEFIKRKRLEDINRKNTWSLYHDASVIFGRLQKLQEKIQNNQSVTYELGVVRGLAESMMNNQIRQINVNEKITLKKIEKWLKDQRICDPSHKDVFVKFAEE